jgi:hypothetical protein
MYKPKLTKHKNGNIVEIVRGFPKLKTNTYKGKRVDTRYWRAANFTPSIPSLPRSIGINPITLGKRYHQL